MATGLGAEGGQIARGACSDGGWCEGNPPVSAKDGLEDLAAKTIRSPNTSPHLPKGSLEVTMTEARS